MLVNMDSHQVDDFKVYDRTKNCKRTDYLFGRELKHGATGSGTFLRLARRNTGKWVGRVHEVWQVAGHIGTLHSPIRHFPHQTVTDFLHEINFYTTLRAEELYHHKITTNGWGILLHTKGKFFQNYFFKLGLLDGIPGLLSALMMSFHAFLVRGKLWLLWSLKKSESDL